MITRRRSLGILGSLAAVAAAPHTGLAQSGQPLVFVAWGGSTQEGQAKAWGDPFTAQTGIPVLLDGPTDYGKIAAMVEAGSVDWDVVDVEHDFAIYAGNAGMLEPLDWSMINRDELDPRFVTDYSFGSFYFSFVLGFQNGAFEEKPQTWADMFDLERFPGKRGYYQWSTAGVYELALLADGVAPEDLYPLDVDRALAKLDTIKSEIVWWGSGAAGQQQLASGETPMGMYWNTRVHVLQTEGEDVGISWEQNMAAADMLVVPKGTRNKEAAMQFLAIAGSAEGQAEMSRLLGLAPTNLKSLELLDDAARSVLPTAHADKGFTLDNDYWAANRDMLGARWYEWQAG